MGFKTNQSNICNPFKIGGLIFDSEEDYLIFKNLDININSTVSLVKRGIIDLKDFFNKIKNIKVKESYYDASEEMDGLFRNSTELLCYEGTRLVTEYKVGCCFFDKIKVLEFDDDDDDDYF